MENGMMTQGVSWKMIGSVILISMTVIGSLFSVAGGVNNKFDDLDDRVTINTERAVTTASLIHWEHRITVVEEAIKDLEKSSHPAGK
jgi:hypothetical protein